MSEQLSFPMGRFVRPAEDWSDAERETALADLTALPARLRAAVHGLTDAQLDTPYRPGGWTLRQVVHHVADSHVNGHIRLRFALTVDCPTIMPYDQDRWAELHDVRTLPVEHSLHILDGIHARWAALARSLTPAERARRFVHPEGGEQTVDQQLALYAWHGRHHTAHITALRSREHWS
jgi:hypothetical protein